MALRQSLSSKEIKTKKENIMAERRLPSKTSRVCMIMSPIDGLRGEMNLLGWALSEGGLTSNLAEVL